MDAKTNTIFGMGASLWTRGLQKAQKITIMFNKKLENIEKH